MHINVGIPVTIVKENRKKRRKNENNILNTEDT
jgi:hypothetical protein